jgi:hypothetical protein
MTKTKKLPKSWDSWRTIGKDDPKRLAKLVESAQVLELARKNLEQEAEALKKQVKEIKDLVLNEFQSGELTAITTKYGTAKRTTTDIPQMDSDAGGWPAIYAFVVGTALTPALAKKVAAEGNWDLLEKRLGRVACRERWEAGVKIPGVKTFTVVDLKLSQED